VADQPPAEVSIDRGLVRSLLRAQAPGLTGRALEHIASGWDNEQWALGEDLIVRLPRRAVAAPLIVNEQAALPGIAARLAHTGVRVPTPIITGVPQADYPWPWSIVPYFSGTESLAVPRGERTAWAGALGTALVALHSPAPPEAPVNPWRGHPLAHRDLRTAPAIAASPTEFRAVLADAWAAGLAATPHAGPAVWIHGDLHPGNLVVDDGRLVAIIDFGDVTSGDPAYDFGIAWSAFDADGRNRFRAAIDVDEATWIRARAWAAAFAAILLTQSDDAPRYRRLAEDTVAELARD